MREGFLRVAAVAPRVNVADVAFNTERIIEAIDRLEAKGVELAVFPEMCLTGYTCGDLFHNTTLLEAAERGLNELREHCRNLNIDVVVGLPMVEDGVVYNMGVFISNDMVGYVKKTYVPTYNEFYERRWWAPSENENHQIFTSHGVKIAIEICEDLWAPIPPSSITSVDGAQVICNLSASNDLIGKYDYLLNLIGQQSARCLCGYVYASAGYGESTTDTVFAGKAIVAECGRILAQNERWNPEDNYVISDIDIDAINHDRINSSTFSQSVENFSQRPDSVLSSSASSLPDALPEPPVYRFISPLPFISLDVDKRNRRCLETVNIQTMGLARRMEVINAKTLVVGISGGLDSTLALLIAIKTFDFLGLDRKGIYAVTMPGFGTSDRTYNNAQTLMQKLGVTIREIPIAKSVLQHFEDIGHDPKVADITYENAQARERTQILMDLANQVGGLVLGTGDLSELALGWATYNGDHMSMYGVNAGIPKTLVSTLVRYFAETTDDQSLRDTLIDIVDTPISPELKPVDDNGEIAQKTEDSVGPYELTDFYLYYTLRFGYTPRMIFMRARKAFADKYDDATLLYWMKRFFRRFFSQQFKRSCLPDGPKVGSICLSPRGDWRMPSDASSRLWISEIEKLEKAIQPA